MKPQKQHLVYLKLPEYMIPYVLRRFGNPVTFREGDRFSKLLSRSLVRIDDMDRQYSRIACSERAHSISLAKERGQLPETECVGTPSGKDIRNFVPIRLPHSVMVSDESSGILRSVAVSPFHTLTLAGAQKLRFLVRQIFWTDFSQFHRDYSSGSTHKSDIFRFLKVQGIDDDMFENVCRTETRLEPEMRL